MMIININTNNHININININSNIMRHARRARCANAAPGLRVIIIL